MRAGELLSAVRRALRQAPADPDEQCRAVVREIAALGDEGRLPTAGAVEACLLREQRDARIRALSRKGVDVPALAARFDVSRRHVIRIVAE